MLVTSEPSSVKIYGDDFTRQFGAVLTSQPEWALPHPRRIFSQPALHWFYGVGSREVVPFDRMLERPPKDKSRDISMVHSPKAMRHTLHHHRAGFMRWLRWPRTSRAAPARSMSTATGGWCGTARTLLVRW